MRGWAVDRLEQLATEACAFFARLMKSKGKRTSPATTMELIARALLIERARTRRLRAELAEAHAALKAADTYTLPENMRNG